MSAGKSGKPIREGRRNDHDYDNANSHHFVIPAQAGIHFLADGILFQSIAMLEKPYFVETWIPAKITPE